MINMFGLFDLILLFNYPFFYSNKFNSITFLQYISYFRHILTTSVVLCMAIKRIIYLNNFIVIDNHFLFINIY